MGRWIVAYLVHKKRQSKTIRSYISAIKAILKVNKILLHEDQYALSAMTKACKLKNDKVRIRKPIHSKLLKEILHQTTEEFTGNKTKNQQPYLDILYRAMFVTAYYGLFRIREIATGDYPILARDVLIGKNKSKILLTLHSSKMHGFGDKPQKIKISAVDNIDNNENQRHYCPFQIISTYLRIRGPMQTWNEPFFVFRDKTPVTPEIFRSTLKLLLTKLNYNSDLFNGHSFRIGRSQDLYKLGVPISTIRWLGRWSTKSNVVYTYLNN